MLIALSAAGFVLCALYAAWCRDDLNRDAGVLVSLACAAPYLVANRVEIAGKVLGAWDAALPLYAVGGALILANFLVLGYCLNGTRKLDVRDLKGWGGVAHFAWGLLQQTLMLAFLCDAVGPAYAVAAFALLHAPNPFLVGVTICGGALAVVVWGIAPSLIVAGLCHGVLSAILDGFLTDEVTGKMRVGRGYLEWRRGRA